MNKENNIIILYILVLLSIVLLIFKFSFPYFENSLQDKSKRDFTDRLFNCFDLDNKNLRSSENSIKLIEFCIKEYGSQ